MTTLPDTFQFTQSSLQDDQDCARRFQLRYVERLAWPAVRAEPLIEHEQHLERGTVFHRLVERHQVGLDPARLGAALTDDTLRAWWDAYLRFDVLHKLDGRRHAEVTLATSLAGSRLAATYDLLVVQPEQVTIFDWKTYTRAPRREWFAARLQTRVYPFVLLRAGAPLFGGPLRAAQIRMVYWIAGAPDRPVIFDYSDEQAARDEHDLAEQIAAIRARPPDTIWPLTTDETHCRFCEYRSLCERGVRAGVAAAGDDLLIAEEPVLRLEDVEEVGF